jgi:hypothetical protein
VEQIEQCVTIEVGRDEGTGNTALFTAVDASIAAAQWRN